MPETDLVTVSVSTPLDLATELSPPVAAALPVVIARVRELLGLAD